MIISIKTEANKNGALLHLTCTNHIHCTNEPIAEDKGAVEREGINII